MKASEIIESVKDLLILSKEVAKEEVIELAEEEVKEEVKKELEEVEEPKEEAEVEAEAEYVTPEDLLEVKNELIAMIQALVEDKSAGDLEEVPEEAPKKEDVELAEVAEEVIHSPEAEVEKRKSLLSITNKSMTTEERVNRMLFNN